MHYIYPNLIASFRKSRKDEKGDGICGGEIMSPKRWILLLVFYISYLMFGASIYYYIEHGEERQKRAEQLKERIEINEYLLEQLGDLNNTTKDEVLERITDYCGKSVLDINKDAYDTPYIWTFYHSFFFAFTVCSTVGYGNISPSTDLGRMIMIVYSVIGIPVNGILFAGLGDYFGKTFQAIYRRYKKYKMSTNVRYVPPQLGLITIILIALVPGIALFLLLPAWIFSHFEGWSYLISFYYSYVTTTTIGFGDYVPTFQPDQPKKFGGWFVVYQIFIIIWFIFSLGYLLMIMTFITRGLQSKKLAYLEQQLSTNIKATQNRIWTGVTKDVGYMRRILNELYILKVKPVYTEPDFSHLLHRSVSCPEIGMYRIEPLSVYSRKRAFSECYDVVEARNFVHASSDTELDKLDKDKSFENAEAFRQTTELLSKVVNALATVKPPMQEEDTTIGSAGMYGGYHGFSDSQILASEWSFSTLNDPPPPRGRACSDFNINPKWPTRRPASMQNEWTWSGDNDQIQEAINHRFKQNDRDQLYRASFGQRQQDYVVQVDDSEFKKQRSKKFSMPDGFRRLFPFKKRSSQDINAGLTASGPAGRDRKYSVMSVPETQIGRAAVIPPSLPLDLYSTVTAGASPSYFRNGKPKSLPITGFPSDLTLAPHRFITTSGAVDPTTTAAMAVASASHQRAAPSVAKKRRESIFTQNPALATRRATGIFPSAASNAAAALSQRRGSLFNTDRSMAGGIAVGTAGTRRGSLFTTQLPSNKRRSSLFSVTSDQDLDVLENTTLADLIRALETVHTQAVMDEAKAPAPKYSALEAVFGDKKKKMSKDGMNSVELPSILSLFAGDNRKALTTTAANRLYARRATIVGTSIGINSHQSSMTSLNNVLTRRRPSSAVQIAEPPPSYSEKDTIAVAAAAAQSTSVASKFKRRFSIRPTALQIPPGKAPPPGVTISPMLQPPTVAGPASSSSNAGLGSSSQTALQRRLSLRPSPLARELNTPALRVADVTSDVGSTSPTPMAPPPSSSTRLLPLPPRPSNISSSTHSPLSRIVQISQAQRKSSMPDGFALDRTKKPDSK